MDERKHMTEDTTSTHLNRWKSRRHLISPDLGRVHKLCSTVQQPHCLKTCLFLYNEPQAWSRRCTCHQNPLRQNQVCVLGPESLPAFAFLKSYSETNYEPKCDQIFSCSASGFILFFSCIWEHEQSADLWENEFMKYKVCAVTEESVGSG